MKKITKQHDKKQYFGKPLRTSYRCPCQIQAFTLIIKKKHNFMTSIILLFFLLTTVVGCTKKDFFTESELEMVEVYSTGDKFSMASSTGDTLVFTIKDRKLEKKKWKCAECFGPTKYEELTYKLNISSISGNQYEGKFLASSLEDQKNLMQYNFTTNNCVFIGEFDITSATENITVGNTNYSNANCDNNACYSQSIGFIRFIDNSCDTITLIP